MTSEIIDNTLAEIASENEAVAEATERCMRAEQAFRDGRIGLDSLQNVYSHVVPDYAYQSAYSGPWAKLERRANRLSRILTGAGARWYEL